VNFVVKITELPQSSESQTEDKQKISGETLFFFLFLFCPSSLYSGSSCSNPDKSNHEIKAETF